MSNNRHFQKANPTVAIVGPAKSSTTIAVQNVLQVFRIPQIGYGATTTDLSDKEQFGYFMRTVPSDLWQARAIMELLSGYLNVIPNYLTCRAL
jgi:ABC-type branched-subunit amino acid transport system substrate-binding protein